MGFEREVARYQRIFSVHGWLDIGFMAQQLWIAGTGYIDE
jgi:heme/copper-type cytochrome/quinol oxidase subunit 1